MGEKGEVLEIKSLVIRQLKYSRHEVSKSDGNREKELVKNACSKLNNSPLETSRSRSLEPVCMLPCMANGTWQM